MLAVLAVFGGVAVSGWSRSTFVVDGGSSGGVDAKGDACVAPTQIGPYPPGLAYWGVSWGSFPFAPAHDRRKSAKSAVWCSWCRGGSRSTIVVDGGSSGGVDAKGDACVAPTQIGPYRPGMAYWGAPWGRSRSPLRMIGANRRILRFGGRGVGVVTVDNRGRWAFTWRCLRTGRRMRRPYTDRPLQARYGLLGRFMGVVPVRPCA